MENNQINITDSAVKKILSLTANEDDGVKLRLSAVSYTHLTLPTTPYV